MTALAACPTALWHQAALGALQTSSHALTHACPRAQTTQVFWRGFFLASLTKVLPLPACVALSSLNFAALHLSPANFLPLLVLSAACDCLYLRTHNLMPPLLLHCAWNSSQVLAIALLGKAEFV